MPSPPTLTHVTKNDYIQPEGGWSFLLLKRKWSGARAYLTDPVNLLPSIQDQLIAVRRDYPSARIVIDENDPYMLYPGRRFPVVYGQRQASEVVA